MHIAMCWLKMTKNEYSSFVFYACLSGVPDGRLASRKTLEQISRKANKQIYVPGDLIRCLLLLLRVMITPDYQGIELKLQQTEGKTRVFDPVRKRWIILTPEEHVRQYILQYLIVKMKYPIALLAVEKTIKVVNRSKRFDIVLYDRNHEPWMLVECKMPGVPIDEKTLHQLLNYQQTIQSKYWMLTNGHEVFCADATTSEDIAWLTAMPRFPEL